MPTFVSVHSCRHGTGKSHLAANLAIHLARQGYRVGILDANQGGVQTLFKLDELQQDGLWNKCLWSRPCQAELVADGLPFLAVEMGHIAVLGQGVCLMANGMKVGEVSQWLRHGEDPDQISQGFLNLGDRLKLDYLLLEHPPGIHENVLLTLAFVDVLLLVLKMEQQDYQGTSVLIDLARRLSIPDLWLVPNQVSAEFQCKQVQQRLESTLGASVAGVLPFTEDLLTFASQGIFCQQFPNHPWSVEVGAIAQCLIHPRRGASSVDTSSASRQPESHPRSASAKLAGLRMLDLLTLPDPQRQTLNWMLRQGSVTLAQIATQTGQDNEQVNAFLASLVERGFVKITETDGEIRYVPNLVARQTAIGRDFWTLLDP